jgi:hypothetical protein
MVILYIYRTCWCMKSMFYKSQQTVQCRPHVLQNVKSSIEGPTFNLSETFANMCKANLKLNPEKCVFEVIRGNVLGCSVLAKGIEASPDKIGAIIQMQPPQTRKEVQKLTSRIAGVNIMKLADRSLPLFSILRGSTKVDKGTE